MIQKKQMMIRFTPLPTDEKVPPSAVGWCPKLTRYKLIGGLTICIIAIFAVVSTLARSGGIGYEILHAPSPSSGCAINFYSPDGDEETENDSDDHSASPDHTQVESPVVFEESSPESGRVHMKKRLPSAIVIGARKAGTRALLRFMNLHPDVVTSKREPHYFDSYYQEGLDWYRQRMPYSYEHQITIEKTPNYFVDRDVPQRVYDYNSTIKLILIVRNPIDRAVSDYLQLKDKFYQNGNDGHYGTFEELAFDKHNGEVDKTYAPIKRSLYCRHLEKWLKIFSLSQIIIVDGENIKIKPWEEVYKVESFLGLSHKVGRDRFIYNETKGFFCIKLENGSNLSSIDDESSPDFIPTSERCLSDSKGRNHPVLDPRARRKLRDFFEPFNNRFFTKISRSFYWT